MAGKPRGKIPGESDHKFEDSSQLDTVRALHQTVLCLRAALEASDSELRKLRKEYQKIPDVVDNFDDGNIEKHVISKKKVVKEDIILKQKESDQKLSKKTDKCNKKECVGGRDKKRIVSTQNINKSEFCGVGKLQNGILKDSLNKNEDEASGQKMDKIIALKQSVLTEDKECQISTLKNRVHFANDLNDRKDDLVVVEKEESTPVKDFNEIEVSPQLEVDSEKEKLENKQNLVSVIENLQYTSSEETVIDLTDKNCKKSQVFETKIEIESKFDFIINVSTIRGKHYNTPVSLEADTGSDCIKLIQHDNLKVTSVPIEEAKMAGSKGGDGDENLTANDPLLAVSENLDYIQDGAEVPQVECEQNTDISIDQDLSLAEQDGIVEQMCERDGIVRVSKVCEQDSISGNDSEEVDDIELIFTTDDTKELHGLQEDLVSITEGDKWPSRDTITAPIVRFTKDSDAPVCRKGVLRSHREARSLQSDDSCSFDRLRSFSFENNRTSGSSFDAVTGDSSFDHREDSLERLDVLASQYSVDVFAERDISKCGVDSFPDVARRNTCPDPPRYRPLAHREAVYGGRPGLGGLAPPAAPLRAPRRSSAAQTDVTALPDRWRSDTHLARKIVQSAPTVPCEGGTRKVADRPLPEIQTTRRSEEARRVLLSDIGFTSMVPELSRSAEPVWAGALPPACCANSFSCIKEAPCFTSRFGSSLFQRSVSSSLLRCMQQVSRGGWRGSLPELRAEGEHCAGQHMLQQQQQQQESSHHNGSTEELLDEADRFLRRSIDCISSATNREDGELCPSQHSRPYLPSGPRQLRLGHLAKVIAPHGRIALGKVRYVGVAGGAGLVYVGLQLSPNSGGGDGCFRGRRYFLCPSGRSLFVPFSKVIMAWADR